MAYQFPPDVDKLFQEHMATGAYHSEDELLRVALKALEEQQHASIEEDRSVIEGIRRGLADVKAGRGQPFEAFDGEFRTKRNIPQDG